MSPTSPRRSGASARWLVVATVAGAILLASVLPRSTGVAPPAGPGPVDLVGADKWLHALAYAGLAGALVFALTTAERPIFRAIALALGGAVAFGFGVELIQAPLPTRRFEPLDAVANGVGATVTVMAWWAARLVGRWHGGRPAS